ncbi:MAG: hypothetical protein WCO00_17690 [Rhodospirillaceae bacterium]
MSAIAREFDCTPSAISYIVRKAEASTAESPEATEDAPPTQPPPPTPTPSAAKAPSPITTLSLPDRGSGQPRVVAAAVVPPTAAAAPPVVPAAAAPPPMAAEAPRPAGTEAAPVKPGQPPPVDAVEGRLRETARSCLVAYRGWRQMPGETSIQGLNDAVHELRKVLARIEIDLSASRREEPGLRPIPVPSHRAARQQQR